MNKNIPTLMSAVLLMGHGGFEKLAYRTNIPTPSPSEGEVLIKVKAAGINNTDVNTRIAWYSKSVSGETNKGATSGFDESEGADGSWSGKPIRFPRIQGADCYGIIVAVGSGVEENRIGEHVLVRKMLRSPVDYRQYECWTFGSDCDGGFAQYAVAPSSDVYRVDSELSPEELGAIPCAYGTAEGVLKPTVAKVFPLREIVDAQKMFIEKSFVGKIVLCPH